jgi:LysM repeat protein
MPFSHVSAAPAHDDITPSDLIAWVNSIRATYGHPALVVDPILMSTALATAQQMAANGVCAHIGHARERIIAAGYGNGKTIWATENMACGGSVTLDILFNNYWNDPDHLIPMVNGAYQNIGAGVYKADDGTVYYVVHAAYVSGGGYTPQPTLPGGVLPTLPPTQNQVVMPVLTVTPMEDGVVVHIVQSGQTLWSIAIAYNVKIAEIIGLNKLNPSDPTIYVGQKLIIHLGYTPTVSPTITDTPLPPTRTPRPSRTPRPTRPTDTPGLAQTSTVEAAGPTYGPSDRRILAIGIIVVCGLGLAIVFLGGLRRKPKTKPDPLDDNPLKE